MLSLPQVLVRIVRDFAHSPSAPQRLGFTHIAAAALATFSASFFAQHLLPPLLALCADRVPDVRIAVAPLMPAAKRTIRLPDGVADLEALNTAAAGLLADPDRRVAAAARAMSARLKAVPVRLASVGVLDMHGASARPECAPAARHAHACSCIPRCSSALGGCWAAMHAAHCRLCGVACDLCADDAATEAVRRQHGPRMVARSENIVRNRAHGC